MEFEKRYLGEVSFKEIYKDFINQMIDSVLKDHINEKEVFSVQKNGSDKL